MNQVNYSQEYFYLYSLVAFVNQEWLDEIKTSIEDGLTRKPDWKSLAKIKNWLFES